MNAELHGRPSVAEPYMPPRVRSRWRSVAGEPLHSILDDPRDRPDGARPTAHRHRRLRRRRPPPLPAGTPLSFGSRCDRRARRPEPGRRDGPRCRDGRLVARRDDVPDPRGDARAGDARRRPRSGTSAAPRVVNRAILAAGVACYSEKPLASSLGEADALIDLAARTGTTFLVAPGSARVPASAG